LERREGLAVLDPHGDLAQTVRGFLPLWRTDPILFNPGDPKNALRPNGDNLSRFYQELVQYKLVKDINDVQRIESAVGSSGGAITATVPTDLA
jgi:hypothetical protein